MSVVAVGVDLTERTRGEEASRRLIREQAARGEAEAAEGRSALLSEASRLLSASMEYASTMKSIAELAATRSADWCSVDILTEEGPITRIAQAGWW